MLISGLKQYLSAAAFSFIKFQVLFGKRPVKGIRCPEEIKCLALQFKGISPKAYRLMRKIFVLPSFSTLNRLMNGINITPGFHAAVIEALRLKAVELNAYKKSCCVSI